MAALRPFFLKLKLECQKDEMIQKLSESASVAQKYAIGLRQTNQGKRCSEQQGSETVQPRPIQRI